MKDSYGKHKYLIYNLSIIHSWDNSKTKDLEGNIVIEYVHRTTKWDGETPISFTSYVE